MSKLLGVIKAIIGQVYVVDANGAQRQVHEGDRVYSGEEIVTGASGAVSISLPDGKTLDIGRNSHWGDHGLQASHNPESSAQDIAAAQKAIADGADPTQVLEATAAGNEAPITLEGGGGGHTLVQLELTGQVVDPTAGFNTKGLGSPNWDINLPVGGIDAGSASVFPPEVQITEFAGNDGFINKNEFHQTHLSGTSNQNHITLTFTDSQKNTFTVTVPVSNGHWNIDTDLGGLVPGNVTVVAIATDVTGRTAESFDHALIDITGPNINISVENVTPDNLINYEESRQQQTLIHGAVGGDAKPGDIVTLLVDGNEYTGVVTDPGNGTLTYTIPVLTQGLLHDPNIHATLTSTDDAGNTTIVSTDHHVDNDLYAQNAVTIETVANDDVVNANEFRMPTIISGVASGDAKAGDPVTLTIQGKAFHGTVFDDHGQLRYEIVVPSATLKEGANDVQVTLVSHDAVGNEATAITHRTVVLDTQAANAISIDAVADDNVVNRSESRMPTLIGGAVTGDAQPGDNVAVAVNGHTFTGVVVTDEHGALRYEVAIPTSVLTEGSNNVEVTVTGVDASGNTAVAVQHTTVVLDTQAANAISIDAVADDNVVNRSESRMPTLIGGAVTGDAQPGDNVAVAVNGHTFTGVVVTDEHGALRYEVAIPTSVLTEGSNNVEVTVTGVDASGNTAVAVQHTTVVLDTQAANAISIDAVADDNVVNRSESRMPTLIGGAVTGDAQPGDNVAVAVNGHTFTGVVVTDEHGALRYEVAIPTSVLTEGSNNVEVTVTGVDASGNTAVAVQHTTVVLDTQAANAISIDAVADDNVVNRSESRMPTLIGGAVTGDAQPGDNVAVAVNGHTFTGVVVTDEHGALRYEVAIPTSVLTEGSNNVEVTVTGVDASGNTAVAVQHTTVVLDTQAHNVLTIDNVTDDNTLNRVELYMRNQVISGTVSGEDAKVGDPLLVEINGHQYNGQVIDLGNNTLGYRIAVNASDFANNSTPVDGNVEVKVSVTSHDAAGNLAIATSNHNVHIDNYAENQVHIGTVAGDNVINIKEFSANGGMTPITGTVTGADAKVGDTVILKLDGVAVMQGAVITLAGGGLGFSFPVNTHMLMTHPQITVSVTSTDVAGNSVTHSETKTISSDMYTQSHITIDGVTADNVINIKESTDNNGKTTISGSVSGDAKEHDTVELVIDGHPYSGEVVKLANGGLGYQIPVDTQNLVNDPVIHASIHTTDDHGNETTATAERSVGLDLNASASIGIDTVAGDDIISKAESELHKTTITGPVGGDAQKDDIVTLTFNGKPYQGKVFELPDHSLGYSIEVSTDNLKDGSDQKVHVSISTVDEHGNPSTVTHDHMVHIDLHAEATITIDQVTDDNILNHLELDKTWQLVSGVVGKDAQVNDDVSVEVNGHTYTGKVLVLGNGQLGYQIPVLSSDFSNNQGNQDKDVTFKASVTSHDAVGNEVVVSTTHKVHIDHHALAGITIDTVAGDNMINGAESTKHTTEVMGTVSGDVHIGDKVTITVNGHHYDTTVQKLPEHNNALGYKLDVLTGDLVKDPHIVARVVGEDGVHNLQKAEATHDMAVDLHAKALLTIDPVTGDNMVNGDESRQPFTFVTGRVGGDVHVNDTVYLTVNGHTLTGKVTDQGGYLGYSIKVSTPDLLADPHLTATVSTTDVAGNPATANAQTTVVIDTRVDATITIDSVTPDNTLNDVEQHQTTTAVTGTVTGEVHPGDPLVMTINGHSYPGFVEVISGNRLGYKMVVSTSDLVANPHIEVSMDITDAAQNHAHIVAHHDVNLDNQALAAITIDRVTGDDVLNGTELQAPKTTISGTVGGDAQVGNTVHLTIGGHQVDTTVVDLPNLGTLGYHIDVDTQWLQNDPHITATITTTDPYGNTAKADATSTVTIDDRAEAIVHIDPLVTDDNDAVINYKEAHNPLTTVTGSVGGDVKVGDLVELTINHQTYYAQVHDDHGKHVFSTEVSTLDLLMDPNIHAEVTAKDAAGNVAHGHDDMPVVIDTLADAGITIDSASSGRPPGNPIANNLLPGSRPDFIAITGHVVPDAVIGDTVTITVGHGFVLTTQVITLPDGQLGYQADIGSDKFADNGDILVSITTHDNHGNTATATEHKFIDLPWLHYTPVIGNTPYGFTTPPVVTPPTTGTGVTQPQKPHVHLTVDPVTGDDVLNGAEAQKPTTPIRGRVTGDAHVGDDVTVTLNNHHYTGKVSEIPGLPGEMTWRVDVPSSELKAHPTFDVSITVSNAAGSDTSSVPKTIQVDTNNPVHITMDKVAGDDVINGKEAQSGKTTISGTVSGEGIHDGSVVSLLVNGNTLTAVVHAGATGWVWSKEVSVNDLRNTPDIIASVSATDAAGNTGTGSTSKHVDVDLKADAGVTVDNITADNVLNAQETGLPTIAVSGSVSGDVHQGESVTLKVNGQTYTATIDANKHYTVDINTSDLVADHSIEATVTGHDNHGNVQDTSITKAFSVDTTATAAVTVNTVGGDDVINADEIKAGTVEVSGTVNGDVHKNDKVYITVNGNPVEATVIELPHMNGQLGYKAIVSTADLQADPTIHVSVTGHDAAGNSQPATYDKTVVIDDHVDATIVLDTVSNDDVLNNVEAGKPTTTITGSVTGDVEVGDLVTVTVNGKDLTAKVTDSGGHKVFRVEASTVDLVHDQHITAHIVAHDDAGNRQQIDIDKMIAIDRVASGTVSVDSVTADNVLNHQELSGQKVTITGHVGGDAQLDDPVTLTIGSTSVNGKVITLSNGHLGYQIDVDSAVLRANTSIDVKVTGHDAPGNPFTATSTHTYFVDEQANGAITINDHIAGDNVVNLNESKSDTVIKFTVSGDTHPTDVVEVSINGNNMKATLVPGSLTVYQVAVPGTYLNEGDNKVEVKTTLHDDAGNTLEVHDQKNVVLDTHADGTITITDGIAGDNVVNQKESLTDTVIRGTVTGDAQAGGTVTVSVNGHDTIATIVADPATHTLGYQAAISNAYLNEGNNDVQVKTTLRDAAGNTLDVSDHKNLILDTHADASIVVDKIAGDNHISQTEAQTSVTHITGSVSGDVQDGGHIKALVNGHQYDAILHQGNNGLTYDIEVETSAFRAGHNRVNVLVEAHDDHGNTTPYTQTLNVTMDDPAPVKGHSVDKGNHAAMQHVLHNLFDDNALSLSYAPAATGHGQATAALSADDKAKCVLEKVDLSDLARELHEGVDIARYIQSGGDHHLIASPAKVAHGIDTALSTPASSDLHSPSYSLDHLIAKPDQNHTH
ncbi:retention module-containing protein [Citrobacter portucalensis]|uniref:retention module-containing protein n=4 Tax=Citrobacter portucalensis TaxID=1639133 RepID=UPI0024336A38|nr:retention module-containing protein [Citrobacter portucalensis]WFZ30166.1 retention module-containing protein [Citrobacter portucalensis]WFZ35166.1 retention module-containing protein [Citrobacter portucalensis]